MNKTFTFRASETREVPLPLTSALAIFLLYVAREKEINSLQMHEAGIISPHHAIGQLRDKGAIIVTEIKPAIWNDKLHKNIAHYTYRGWN